MPDNIEHPSSFRTFTKSTSSLQTESLAHTPASRSEFVPEPARRSATSLIMFSAAIRGRVLSLAYGFSVASLTPSKISDRMRFWRLRSSCTRFFILLTFARPPSRMSLLLRPFWNQSLYSPVYMMIFAMDWLKTKLYVARIKGLKAGMITSRTAPRDTVTGE